MFVKVQNKNLLKNIWPTKIDKLVSNNFISISSFVFYIKSDLNE